MSNSSVPDLHLEEVEDEEHQENPYKGTCLAIPYIPSNEDGVEIPNGAGGAVLVQEDHLWDNGATITYAFMPRKSSRPEWGEQKVHQVIKEWSLYANIEFQHVPDPSQALVRIAFDRSDGSWSLTGKKMIEECPADKPTMNLGGVEKINKMQENDVGTILHEFGHTLGLKHEHQSPLRKEVYGIDEKFTIEAFKHSQGWSEEEVRQQILNTYTSEDVGNFTDLDLTSVMMYFMPAQQNDKGLEIKPNNALSVYDKAFMLIHYPYFGFEPKVEGWDFSKALDIFGIQGSDREEMMELYSAGNVRDVRRHFAKVYERTREARNAELARSVAAAPTTAPSI